MESKAHGKTGSRDKTKMRKLLYILCLVLLAIVAFRKWSRGADGGTAGQTAAPEQAVTVLADSPVLDTAPPAAAATEMAPQVATETASQVATEMAPQAAPAQATAPATEKPASPAATETASQAATEMAPQVATEMAPQAATAPGRITEDGQYTSKDDVALYIHTYGHLPGNFITKAEAKALGWGDQYSSVDDAAPGKSIGGDRFGNREGLLPKQKGRTYTECDIGTRGKKSRGAKRIVFSNDGLIYYTGDHYESFELLYGSE